MGKDFRDAVARANYDLENKKTGTKEDLERHARDLGCNIVNGSRAAKIYLNGNYVCTMTSHSRKITPKEYLGYLSTILFEAL